jgi:hypothetical protein
MTSTISVSESSKSLRPFKLQSQKSISSFSTTFSTSTNQNFPFDYYSDDKQYEQNKSINEDLKILFNKIPLNTMYTTRTKYYSSLIYKNIMKKQINCNNIFIYDWDDTFFCTTHLFPNGVHDEKTFRNALQFIDKMQILEELVYNILFISISKGKVYIVTNSSPGWVELCIKRFYPKLFSLLSNLTIISARRKYFHLFPDDMQMWKILTFEEIADEFNTYLVTNIICMGDNDTEIEAAELLVHKFKEPIIKTIKLKEKPSFNDLKKTLKVIYNDFNTIYSSCKSLTINVCKSKK